MRLWHKYLIPYLPQKQLVAQWRECCAIARNIAVNGYSKSPAGQQDFEIPHDSFLHFFIYASMVLEEMRNRGYRVSQRSLDNFQKNCEKFKDDRLETVDVF